MTGSGIPEGRLDSVWCAPTDSWERRRPAGWESGHSSVRVAGCRAPTRHGLEERHPGRERAAVPGGRAHSRRDRGMFRSCKVPGAVIKGIYRLQDELRESSQSWRKPQESFAFEPTDVFPRISGVKVLCPRGDSSLVLPQASPDSAWGLGGSWKFTHRRVVWVRVESTELVSCGRAQLTFRR